MGAFQRMWRLCSSKAWEKPEAWEDTNGCGRNLLNPEWQVFIWS